MTFMATCKKCGGKFGHPGPCPNCEPSFGPHVFKAMDLAYQTHRNEWRKKRNRPYIAHIIDIMDLAESIGINIADIVTYRSIILHDVIESGGSIEDIKAICTMTASIVQELTFVEPDEANRKVAKQAYMDSFTTKSIVAVVVKTLDRLANTSDFLRDDPNYAVKYFHQADKLFQTVRDRWSEIAARYSLDIYNNLIHAIEDMELILCLEKWATLVAHFLY